MQKPACLFSNFASFFCCNNELTANSVSLVVCRASQKHGSALEATFIIYTMRWLQLQLPNIENSIAVCVAACQRAEYLHISFFFSLVSVSQHSFHVIRSYHTFLSLNLQHFHRFSRKAQLTKKKSRKKHPKQIWASIKVDMCLVYVQFVFYWMALLWRKTVFKSKPLWHPKHPLSQKVRQLNQLKSTHWPYSIDFFQLISVFLGSNKNR